MTSSKSRDSPGHMLPSYHEKEEIPRHCRHSNYNVRTKEAVGMAIVK